MDFKDKLFELRKASGLSQEEVAGRLNVSRQTVSKWESGQSCPEMDKLPAISALFQVSLDYLLKPSEVDALSIKAIRLENQQQVILAQQMRAQNRQYLIVSSIMALAAIAIVYLAGKYVMFPDVGDGYTFLGKSIVYGGVLLIIAATVLFNWRFRRKNAPPTPPTE